MAECLWRTNLEYSNHNAGEYYRVYRDLEFQCYGKNKGWHFHAHRAGTAFLDVFKSNGDGTYNLMSKTEVTSTGAGNHTMMLSEEDHVQIGPGYVIGYHFQNAAAAPGGPWGGMPCSGRGCPGFADRLCRIIAVVVH